MPYVKNLSIETVRGIAIFLVVVGHVIGSAPDGGMCIDFPSPWRYVYGWIDYIQMPLFTAIAGWIYALKPIGGTTFGAFAGSKFKRLLIPMITVGTLYFLIQYFAPGTNGKEALSDIWRIYLFPFTVFWYLQALFLIFLVIFCIERLNLMSTFKGASFIFLGAWLLYILEICSVFSEVPNFFCFRGAFNQLPYFLIGVAIFRFKDRLNHKPIQLVLSVLGIVMIQVKWFMPDLSQELYRSLIPLWMAGTLPLIFYREYTNKLFIYLGAYAYTIYLFHGFGTSGGRIILSYLHIHTEWLVFTISLLLGVFAPILVDKVCNKSKSLRVLFLGKK